MVKAKKKAKAKKTSKGAKKAKKATKKKAKSAKKAKKSKTAAKAKKTAKRSKAAKRPKTAKKAKKSKRPKKASSGASAPMPAVGDMAPGFTLPAGPGRDLGLTSFRGRKNVVLYFYPKDDTPGCTVEACNFQAGLGAYDDADTVVIGVSPDSLTSHARFKDKYNLNFELVADEANDVARSYGVWVLKNMYGREYMGIQRATFLIDKQGRIAATWPKVSVNEHHDEVLKAVRSLG